MPSFKLIRLEIYKVILRTKSYSNELSNSKANNSSCFGPITSIIELTRDLMALYCLTKFGAD